MTAAAVATASAGSLVTGGNLLLSVPLALLAGAVSFASPCVLPLVPGYLGYVGGMHRSAARGSSRLVLGAALFVLGFSVVFVLGGFVFGGVGLFLRAWSDPLTRVLGVLVIVMGVVFLGGFGPLQRMAKTGWQPRTGLIGAPLLGVVFAVGWSPCIGPTLAAIESLAISGGSAGQGALLAACYSLGLGVPFLLIALGLGWATRGTAFLRRHIRAVNLAGGGLLVAVGVLMVSGVWLALTGQLQILVGSVVTAV